MVKSHQLRRICWRLLRIMIRGLKTISVINDYLRNSCLLFSLSGISSELIYELFGVILWWSSHGTVVICKRPLPITKVTLELLGAVGKNTILVLLLSIFSYQLYNQMLYRHYSIRLTIGHLNGQSYSWFCKNKSGWYITFVDKKSKTLQHCIFRSMSLFYTKH